MRQPGQPAGITPVGLDPIPARAFQPGTGPSLFEGPGQTKPVGNGLIGDGTGPGNRPTRATTCSLPGTSRLEKTCPMSQSTASVTTDRV
jgi:hypothetical protein